jgi:hypothetical protein
MLGLLTDLMLDTSVELAIRRRIPRIIAEFQDSGAADALLAGLDDHRFEVRLQCARSLVKACAREPHSAVQTGTILTAVDRELAIAKCCGNAINSRARIRMDRGRVVGPHHSRQGA